MNQLVANTVILVFLCTFLQVFATYTSFATHDYGRARRPGELDFQFRVSFDEAFALSPVIRVIFNPSRYQCC